MIKQFNFPYILESSPDYYQVFSTKGRLLMYFKIMKSGFDLPVTKVESNINFCNINDDFIKYCINKIHFEHLTANKIEYYINKIIGRIMRTENNSEYFINPHFLSNDGTFQPALYNIYYQIKKRLTKELENDIDLEIPYTENTHSILMEIFNDRTFFTGMMASSEEITKDIFERGIPNEKIAHAYVDIKNSKAKYFRCIEEGKPDDVGYFMVVKNRVILLFGTKEL